MNQMKLAGIILIVLALVCLFVAVERYQANASWIAAMNQYGGERVQLIFDLTPSTPAVTKYALLGALIFGSGGAFCLLNSKAVKAKPIR